MKNKRSVSSNSGHQKGFTCWVEYWWQDFIGALKNLGQQSPAAFIAIFFGCFMCIVISVSLVSSLFTPILPLNELDKQKDFLWIYVRLKVGVTACLYYKQTTENKFSPGGEL